MFSVKGGGLPSFLAGAVKEAGAAWPGIQVPDDAFASYLLARCDGGDASGVHLGDLYIACACARGDASAIAAFERVFLAPVPDIVRRTGAPEHVVSEVTQIVRTRLLGPDEDRPARIVEYGGRGPLAGWIRVVAVRAAASLHRADERARIRADAPVPVPPESPEDLVIRSRYGAAFKDAFRDAFQALAPEERLVLRLHFAEQLSLDRLATALGFSRATAGRRLLGARTRLRDETMRLLGDRLKASEEELESVLAALRSHLALSLSSLVSAA